MTENVQIQPKPEARRLNSSPSLIRERSNAMNDLATQRDIARYFGGFKRASMESDEMFMESRANKAAFSGPNHA